MAFARLFPIDVANAQDGDRTFSERLGLSDDACCSLQSPRRVPALALLKQYAVAVATSREGRRQQRSGRPLQWREIIPAVPGPFDEKVARVYSKLLPISSMSRQATAAPSSTAPATRAHARCLQR